MGLQAGDAGKTTYVTQSTDFPVPGYYQVQPVAQMGAQTLRGAAATLQVGAAL